MHASSWIPRRQTLDKSRAAMWTQLYGRCLHTEKHELASRHSPGHLPGLRFSRLLSPLCCRHVERTAPRAQLAPPGHRPSPRRARRHTGADCQAVVVTVSRLLAVPHPETNAARLVGLLEYARLKGRPLREAPQAGASACAANSIHPWAIRSIRASSVGFVDFLASFTASAAWAR